MVWSRENRIGIVGIAVAVSIAVFIAATKPEPFENLSDGADLVVQIVFNLAVFLLIFAVFLRRAKPSSRGSSPIYAVMLGVALAVVGLLSVGEGWLSGYPIVFGVGGITAGWVGTTSEATSPLSKTLSYLVIVLGIVAVVYSLALFFWLGLPDRFRGTPPPPPPPGR